MPIYEFACSHCKTVFQFWTQRIQEKKIPDCPQCGRSGMQRLISSFAIGKGIAGSPGAEPTGGGGEENPFAGMAPDQQEHAEREMMNFLSQADSLDENDPRQMGAFMRKMKESTGMNLGPEMDEAIRRLEKGEDPDAIEEDLGDLLGGMEGGGAGPAGGAWSHDETLYDL